MKKEKKLLKQGAITVALMMATFLGGAIYAQWPSSPNFVTPPSPVIVLTPREVFEEVIEESIGVGAGKAFTGTATDAQLQAFCISVNATTLEQNRERGLTAGATAAVADAVYAACGKAYK